MLIVGIGRSEVRIMFFTTWWQGLLFGVFTLVIMAMIAYVFTALWDPYEDGRRPGAGPGGR